MTNYTYCDILNSRDVGNNNINIMLITRRRRASMKKRKKINLDLEIKKLSKAVIKGGYNPQCYTGRSGECRPCTWMRDGYGGTLRPY